MRDYVTVMEQRLRSIDPEYGTQDHQRAFIARCRVMDTIQPCTKDHDADTPPEHRYGGQNACYTETTQKAAYEAQRVHQARAPRLKP